MGVPACKGGPPERLIMHNDDVIAHVRREDGCEGVVRCLETPDYYGTPPKSPYVFTTYGEGNGVEPGKIDAETRYLEHLYHECASTGEELHYCEDDFGVYGVVSLASAPVYLEEVVGLNVGVAEWVIDFTNEDGCDDTIWLNELENLEHIYSFMDTTPVLETVESLDWEVIALGA